MDSHFPHHKWFSSVFTDTTTFSTHRQLETPLCLFSFEFIVEPFFVALLTNSALPQFLRGSYALIRLISWSNSLSGICQYCHLIWGTSTMFLSLWHSRLLFLSALCHGQALVAEDSSSPVPGYIPESSLLFFDTHLPPHSSTVLPSSWKCLLRFNMQISCWSSTLSGENSPDRTLNKTGSEF